MEPKFILQQLSAGDPVALKDIPFGAGIYALFDHKRQARYVGITSRCLNNRIFSRHVGGDGNSHKFSTAYNAGRMFHARNHPATCPIDGAIAKELRRLFVRAHCAAVALTLPAYGMDQLLSLEAAVCAMAPPEMLAWNNSRVLKAVEPSELVDAFLQTLDWSDIKLKAVERQAERWNAVVASQQSELQRSDADFSRNSLKS